MESKSHENINSRIQVAVIGAGIAGLSCGWILGQNDNFEVILYERGKRGLDAFTHQVEIDQCQDEKYSSSGQKMMKNGVSPKRNVLIDVPFRVHIPSYYPNMTELCKQAGVSVESLRNTTMITNTDFQHTWGYKSLNLGIYSIPWIRWSWQLFRWRFLRCLWQFIRLRYESVQDALDPRYCNITIGQYFDEKRYSNGFVEEILFPFLSAACTCSYEGVRNYPANVILNYFVQSATKNRQWRRFSNGSTDVVSKLERGFSLLHYSTGVDRIESIQDGKKVRLVFSDGSCRVFDHVVMATPPNCTARFLCDDQMKIQKDLLSSFTYERSSITIHSDDDLFVSDRNVHEDSKFSVYVSSLQNRPMIHLKLNSVYSGLRDQPKLYETWNCWNQPKKECIKACAEFERPLVTIESQQALSKLLKMQGDKNIWFAGSYCTPGSVPLLEGGVLSGISVARKMGAGIPWDADYSSVSVHSFALIGASEKQKKLRHSSATWFVAKIYLLAMMVVILAMFYFF